MKKILYLSFIFAFLAAGFVSCDSDDDNGPVLSIKKPSNVTANATDNGATISLEAVGAWKASITTEDADWLSINPTEGVNNADIKVTFDENKEEDSRIAVVTIVLKEKDSEKVEVTVTQYGTKGPDNGDKFELPYEKVSFRYDDTFKQERIDLDTDDYTIEFDKEENKEWVGVTERDDYFIVFMKSVNEDKDNNREAVLTVTDNKRGESAELTVIQSANGTEAPDVPDGEKDPTKWFLNIDTDNLSFEFDFWGSRYVNDDNGEFIDIETNIPYAKIEPCVDIPTFGSIANPAWCGASLVRDLGIKYGSTRVSIMVGGSVNYWGTRRTTLPVTIDIPERPDLNMSFEITVTTKAGPRLTGSFAGQDYSLLHKEEDKTWTSTLNYRPTDDRWLVRLAHGSQSDKYLERGTDVNLPLERLNHGGNLLADNYEFRVPHYSDDCYYKVLMIDGVHNYAANVPFETQVVLYNTANDQYIDAPSVLDVKFVESTSGVLTMDPATYTHSGTNYRVGLKVSTQPKLFTSENGAIGANVQWPGRVENILTDFRLTQVPISDSWPQHQVND